MRTLLLLTALLILAPFTQAQKESLNLKNALVIGQFDKPEDRYSMEINFTDMLAQRGVKAVPSLNILKLGEDPQHLTNDSIQAVLKEKGIDTYVVVSVRGYDRRFKESETQPTLNEALGQASLFSMHKDEIVSISFDFKFFRNGTCVYSEIVKCGNIGDRDSVIKRFRKKVGKKLDKKWLN